MRRILIPVDGSDCSKHALKHAIGLTKGVEPAFEVLLLNVQPPVPSSKLLLSGNLSNVRALEEPLRAEGARLLEKARKPLDDAAIPNRSLVEVGDAAPAIARAAKQYHCEMIVMGTHGRSALSGLVMGSIATKVVHLSPVPVTLVP